MPGRGCPAAKKINNNNNTMNKINPILTRALLCSALLALGLQTTPAGEKAAPGREDAVLVSVTASIEAIDAAKREVTLKGPLGNTVIFTVDERVKRLNEFKVGDFIRADYYVSIAAELRKPTA